MQLEETIRIPTETLLFLFFAGAVAEEIMGLRYAPSADSSLNNPGLTPATAGPANLLHLRWFSVHFSMVLQRLGITDWRAAQDVLAKFLYDERTMGGHVRALFAKRSEFLGVLSIGEGGGREGHPSASQGDAGATSGTSFLGQQGASPGIGASASSSSQTFPPGSSSKYLQTAPSMPAISALSPIAAPDFEAGFWEHMGLGMDADADADVEFQEPGDEGEE